MCLDLLNFDLDPDCATLMRQGALHELAHTLSSSSVMQSEEIDVLAQVASGLRIPAVIVELRIFEWREELASKGRPVKRLAPQVQHLAGQMIIGVRPQVMWPRTFR